MVTSKKGVEQLWQTMLGREEYTGLTGGLRGWIRKTFREGKGI